MNIHIKEKSQGENKSLRCGASRFHSKKFGKLQINCCETLVPGACLSVNQKISNKEAPALKYLVIAAILQIFWGLVPSASKIVIDEIPVELYIALRWSISGSIFCIILLSTSAWKSVPLKDCLAVSGIGILGYGVGSLGALYGLKIGGVTNFALMGAFAPLVTSLIAVIALKERPHLYFYPALVAAVGGMSLLVVGKYQVSSWSVAGASAILILTALLLEAIVFVGSRRYKEKMHVVQYLAITQVAAASLMWTLQITTFNQTAMLAHLTLSGASAAVFVSIVACVLCYWILYWLLNHIDGHRLALFDGFHTLSATLFGYFIFMEPVRPIIVLGGMLMFCGMIVGNLPFPPKVPN